jgi:hypothetical protein
MTSQARWLFALACTVLTFILLGVLIGLGITAHHKLDQISMEQQVLQKQLVDLLPLLETSSMAGNNDLSLKRMINSLNTIERFVRTTPLVECGNWNDRRQKERVVHGSDK